MNYHSKKFNKVNQQIVQKNEASTNLPPLWLAFTPLLIVIVGNYLFSQIFIPNWSTHFLAEKIFGEVELKAVKGLWAIIISLSISIIFIIVAMKKYSKDTVKSINEGTFGSMLPIFNTASEVGYGSVIASLASFTLIKEAALNLSPNNPLISEAIAINLLAGITGSSSGGMSIGLGVLGPKYLEMANQLNISPDLLHRVATLSSGGFDTLPHNGAVISLLAICGLTHKDSYLDIFMVAVAIPVLATIVVVILGTSFGSF
jgi:H+/gluconate symporter-like permease